MRLHGGPPIRPQLKASATSRRATTASLAALVARQDDGIGTAGFEAAGFRHWLGPPGPARRYRIAGRDPLESGTSLAATRLLMSRLAARMDAGMRWPASAAEGVEDWENPGIPSGYTYLLQLVGHDLVQSSFPASLAERLAAGTTNARETPLKLDTLYGGGPIVCPFAYALDDAQDLSRTRLRLGPMRDAPGSPPRFRDIARLPAAGLNGVPRVGRTEPLIADPRNDDNAILSQLLALFHHFHNGVVDLLPSPDAGDLGAAYRRFLCARGAVALVYRAMVREDLLARLLHPSVASAFAGSNPALVEPPAPASTEWRPPVEFTHGAFRCGHAMVRDRYRINDRASFGIVAALDRTSARRPASMPLDEAWIVRWSHFFDLDGSRPNLSRRIGPEYSVGFLDDGLFAPFDGTGRVGLAYRDLMSGIQAGHWGLDHLIGELAGRVPGLIGSSRLLDDHAYRRGLIADWLAQSPVGDLGPDEASALAEDPPLGFFLLFEAAHEPGYAGSRLGVLGSLIVADVVIGALAGDPLPAERGARDLASSLATLSTSIYDRDLLGPISGIRGMADLVAATADLAGLRTALPAFL